MEVQFARESSNLLPKSDPLFRVRVTFPSQRCRDKTAEEWSAALKATLGKRSNSYDMVTIDQFRVSIKKISNFAKSSNNEKCSTRFYILCFITTK